MPKESTSLSNAMNHHTLPAITLALLLCLR